MAWKDKGIVVKKHKISRCEIKLNFLSRNVNERSNNPKSSLSNDCLPIKSENQKIHFSIPHEQNQKKTLDISA